MAPAAAAAISRCIASQLSAANLRWKARSRGWVATVIQLPGRDRV